ncbi:serine/threonine-protein kinase pim-2-like [Triplophysa dalaica]|uniref:serine/threonine-protein kinase pim-2-like n=1 Tax=Triplophysa dalaica TaxID=1582913 RepID=UPI0024E022FB|nr:serine/threonine-protein kinase pim-2-like [Triplophysa dalaica]
MASTSATSSITPNDMERDPDQQTEKKKKKGMRASFKKRWRAVKGCCSCTQSNDLDPSEEPYLPVLNPVVLADTADHPGCDWEQTPLEDPVDPPQDPSGLKQTAPDEPTDDTAEQQTEEKKKKGVRASFKKGWKAIKHSCARNNKVVPLPTQSDLDSSVAQPAPEDPQPPAPEDPQPAPEDPQPAPEDPEAQWKEEMDDFYRGLSDFDPFVQEMLKCFYPYSFPKFPAPWYTRQEFLHELDKFEAFSALYKVGRHCLGKGHAGIVYRGTRKSDGLKVAIKFIYKQSPWDRFIHVPGYDKPLFSEVAVNLMLQKPERCPNIVALLDWFEEEEIYILVLEFPYPCLSLDNFLRYINNMNVNCPLSEENARALMRQAVNAAQHCIDHDVCHGSLGIRNMLINIQTMTLMFIDFGRAHLASTWGKPDPRNPDPRPGIPGPTWVEAGGESWGRGHAVADLVYCLGTLLLCLMGGLWLKIRGFITTEDIPEIKTLGLSEECFDLVNRCTLTPPPDRPTLEELLDHEWFKQG